MTEPLVPQMPREFRVVVVTPSDPPPVETVLRGRCWVVDGDTIVINKTHLRLAGIDAPELDHPFGQQSKWALVKLCRGQTITARIKPEMSYDRVVAECFLPDGRDLAAEMVRSGLALDWPKFSGGKYRHLETPDARKKLWRASIRQRGMASLLDDLTPIAPQPMAPRPVRTRPADPGPFASREAKRYIGRWLAWLIVPGLLVVLVGCALTNTGSVPDASPVTRQQTAPPAIFVVTAPALNVRSGPSGSAEIITQLERGMMVVPHRVSGRWYAILLQNGRTGWVHSQFLGPAGN